MSLVTQHGDQSPRLSSPQTTSAWEVPGLLLPSSHPPHFCSLLAQRADVCPQPAQPLTPSKPLSKPLLAHFPPSTAPWAPVTLVSPKCAGSATLGNTLLKPPPLGLEVVVGWSPY